MISYVIWEPASSLEQAAALLKGRKLHLTPLEAELALVALKTTNDTRDKS